MNAVPATGSADTTLPQHISCMYSTAVQLHVQQAHAHTVILLNTIVYYWLAGETSRARHTTSMTIWAVPILGRQPTTPPPTRPSPGTVRMHGDAAQLQLCLLAQRTSMSVTYTKAHVPPPSMPLMSMRMLVCLLRSTSVITMTWSCIVGVTPLTAGSGTAGTDTSRSSPIIILRLQRLQLLQNQLH